MSQIHPPPPQHSYFTAWSKRQGVRMNNVGPAKIPGSGLGMVAQQQIEAGEELVNSPFSALLTLKSVPTEFRRKHEGITVHGLLAAFLAFGGKEVERYELWKASWPSMRDVRESMPILWPEMLRWPLNRSTGEPIPCAGERPVFPLPPAVGGRWSHEKMAHSFMQKDSLLSRQEKKLKKDWEMFSKHSPNRPFEEFTYYWLIVNTRSFYYELPGMSSSQPRSDCMVLCPVVDYFNHQDSGCDVSFDEKGFAVTSDRAYDAGEEIFVSYGSHSNDFLLVEYGFILENNKWDTLPLDNFFLSPRFPSKLKGKLENAGYWGNYSLNNEGVCHRTQVAVRTKTLDNKSWNKFVAGLDIKDDQDEPKADALVAGEIMLVYFEEAEAAIECLERLQDVLPHGPSDLLIKRWRQVRDLVREAFTNGINERTQAEMRGKFGL